MTQARAHMCALPLCGQPQRTRVVPHLCTILLRCRAAHQGVHFEPPALLPHLKLQMALAARGAWPGHTLGSSGGFNRSEHAVASFAMQAHETRAAAVAHAHAAVAAAGTSSSPAAGRQGVMGTHTQPTGQAGVENGAGAATGMPPQHSVSPTATATAHVHAAGLGSLLGASGSIGGLGLAGLLPGGLSMAGSGTGSGSGRGASLGAPLSSAAARVLQEAVLHEAFMRCGAFHGHSALLHHNSCAWLLTGSMHPWQPPPR